MGSFGAILGAVGGVALPGVGGFAGEAVGGAVDAILGATQNGAEVRRQLSSWPAWKLDLYTKWLAQYDAGRLQSGNVWDPGNGNASKWNDAYYSANAANAMNPDGSRPWPEGKFTLDGSLRPVMLGASTSGPAPQVRMDQQGQSGAQGAGVNVSVSFFDGIKAWWTGLKTGWKVVVIAVPVALVAWALWPTKKRKFRRSTRKTKRTSSRSKMPY